MKTFNRYQFELSVFVNLDPNLKRHRWNLQVSKPSPNESITIQLDIKSLCFNIVVYRWN